MSKVHGEHSLEEQGEGAGPGGQTMAARREKLRRALERLARAEEVRGADHQAAPPAPGNDSAATSMEP